jgi:hypothetical protein
MPTKSYLSFAGFLVLIVATYCPLLRPFAIKRFDLDLYHLSQPFGILILLIGVIGILGVVLKQKPIAKLCGWIALILVTILLVAVRFKIHSFFGIIPFKSIARFFEGTIKYKWGWFLLFGGPILAIMGISTTKSGKAIAKNKLK